MRRPIGVWSRERLRRRSSQALSSSRAQPVLRWTGIDGARYRVRVLTADLQVLEESAESSALEYTLSQETLARIPPGTQILWQVEAQIPGEVVDHVADVQYPRAMTGTGQTAPDNPLAQIDTAPRGDESCGTITSPARVRRDRVALVGGSRCVCSPAPCFPRSARAQTPSGPTVTVLKSGLHSIFEGHTLLLTVTEVGSTTSTSAVTIEFLDASDQRRGFASGTLKRAAPRATAGRHSCRSRLSTALRAIVKITPLTNGAASEPIVGLEDLDADSFRSYRRSSAR